MRIVLVISLLACACGVREKRICVENCPEPDASLIDASTDGKPFPIDGPPPDACINTGPEVCDNLDNDCDGSTDESPIPGVDEPCSKNEGECTAGMTQCVNGDITCSGTTPAQELCDTLDNDCDGTADENNPEGGQICGSPEGECQTGLTQCSNGVVSCQGEVTGTPEVCDGKDNDCDTMFDEGIASGGSCGTTDMGECALGTLMCVGGSEQCVGAVGPSQELCDGLDHDCDGNPLNGFNTDTDPRNCGTCGNVCTVNNGTPACANGNCSIAVCDNGYWNTDNNIATGCNYGPCQFQSTQEACNQSDDDCDEIVDENLVPPDICDPDGACATPTKIDPSCTANGWKCQYNADVETDVDGNIVEETRCDGIDNDCDGVIDEGDPLKGDACSDGNQGICQGFGTYICDPQDATAPVICNITQPGQPAGTEVCNNLDDDCNGTIDDGVAAGGLQPWVNIGGVEILAYEASRPDATSNNPGAITTHVCAAAGRQPWTSVTAPDAEAACQSIGARLCTEAEWEQACEANSSCDWSYDSSCSTYQSTKCNGNDYDSDPGTAGDQDSVLATGSLSMCYADWGGNNRIYDMSGNVKEWTAPRQAGVNPQRGGSYSTPGGGMRCDYNFIVADDAFFFPTVGFRCCR